MWHARDDALDQSQVCGACKSKLESLGRFKADGTPAPKRKVTWGPFKMLCHILIQWHSTHVLESSVAFFSTHLTSTLLTSKALSFRVETLQESHSTPDDGVCSFRRLLHSRCLWRSTLQPPRQNLGQQLLKQMS